jgi:hypothetical protein
MQTKLISSTLGTNRFFPIPNVLRIYSAVSDVKHSEHETDGHDLKSMTIILFSDRWTTFNKSAFLKNQKYEHGGLFKVKMHILFCGDAPLTVALKRMKFCTVNTDISKSCIWNIFDGVFEYGNDSKFWGYVETNAEQLCTEFCNFVQCHTFINFLPCYY